MRIQYGPEADAELEEATAWYIEHAWDVAERFVTEVERVSALVVERPALRAEVEPGVRRALLHGFPYSLIYTVETDHIFVLAVMHMKRHPDYWKSRGRR